ncbi:MAG: ATP-binding protein [Myxococcaceae bacterium]|nr:ATP-binding protein [Myxococcaceae bacterium]MCI0673730.1 ATP-binding protein [Myxococcaceae bacterium]
MKSRVVPLSPAPQPSPVDYEAFFEALEVPAALCTPSDFGLLAGNAAFDALCGGRLPRGLSLLTVFEGLPDEAPEEGAAVEVEVALGGAAPTRGVRLSLSRRNGVVALLGRPVERGFTERSARREEELLELSRRMVGVTSEEMLEAAVAHGVKALFPGAHFCVRVCDARTLELSSLYAEGRLREGARDELVLKRSALLRMGVSPAALPEGRVRLVEDAVPPLFLGTHSALCAPLVASGQLFGALTVEYPEGLAADLVGDRRLLKQLANQVAVAVRNVKLIDELTFVRKYLEELLEHANALIVVLDRERRVGVFNKAFRELTGMSREDVLGQDALEKLPGGERARVGRAIGLAMEGHAVGHIETRVLGPEGREVRISLAVSAVRNPLGVVEGVICIGQDLTALRQLEQRIIQAEKLASLGQLAASVVHEINNPMTAVATYAEVLLQQARARPDGGGADAEKLERIREAGERILRFTRDLVSYARPAQDRMERVDLHQVLDMAVGFCDHVVARAGVHLVREYGALPPLQAVRGHLAQVFVNLVTNACHACGPGGHVWLCTRREGADAVVEVRDSGSGIDPRHLHRIFEPFFTTKPQGKGTGLGLAIVHSIVEAHGGAISVASTPGEGTTFTLRLPLRE